MNYLIAKPAAPSRFENRKKNRFFSVKIFIFLMIFKNVALHDQRNKKNSLNNVPEKST